MTPFDFLLAALATGYLAYVMTATDGVFGVFRILRTRLPLGGLTTCIYCISPWIALVMYGLLFTPASFLVAIFAIAGAGLMLSAYSGLKHL